MESTESCPRKRKRLNSDDCDVVKLKRNDSFDEDVKNNERGLLDLSDEILLEIFENLNPTSLLDLGW